jgi:capsular polysaccharide biosynthesis protein
MDRPVTALIPAEAPPFVEETLQLLSWPSSKIEHATAPIYDVQNLVVPSYPERTASDFEWIRKDVLHAASDQRTPSGSGNNVYVSRSNATERRVLNEDAVMDVLSEYGFSKYHLEDRSVQANARLFNEADIVVGPHGAGLTDIIFAEDCTLVELFGEKVKQPYQALADTLGIDYRPMFCMADSADIVVDTDELESTISRQIP